MGGSSKRVTVGYKYYLGMHMVLCHGPVDYLREIKVGDKSAFTGLYSGGRITINKQGLFGGEEREGGLQGSLDFEMGRNNQGRNDYLQARLGSNIPAFRGVVGAVIRRMYLGVNPYLKKWSWKIQRIHTRQDGIEQWYDEKAQIGVLTDRPLAIFISHDRSGSMSEITENGETRARNAADALAAVMRFLGESKDFGALNRVDVRSAFFSSSTPEGGGGGTDFTYLNASNVQLEAAAQYYEALSDEPAGGTYWPEGVENAASFFASVPSNSVKLLFFITDGQPVTSELTLQEVTDLTLDLTSPLFSTVDVYAINIDLTDLTYTRQIENTPEDGVPIVSGGDPSALTSIIVSKLSGQLDLNPAHIIRECLTDPDWGMGYQDADVDETSFVAAADQLVLEQMGISLLWDRQISIEEFINVIVRHIDAALYVDRKTGKFVLKLIRNDYDKESLLVLDQSNIERMEKPSRPTLGELTNSVTVNYWDYRYNKTASLTAQDIALVQIQNGEINTTVQYPGFTNGRTAGLAAQRDLKALSSGLLSTTLYCNRDARELNPGDPVVVTFPDFNIYERVFRVTGIQLGDGKSNKVRLGVTEDVFEFPEVSTIVEQAEEDGFQEETALPIEPPYRIVGEVPYYELVQGLGQAEIDPRLNENPELGYVYAAAGRIPLGLNSQFWVDSGAGYENVAILDFCPFFVLDANIDPRDTVLSYSAGEDLDEIVLGTFAEINGEFIIIDSVDELTSEITVQRGALDTVPVSHASGSFALAWDRFSNNDNTEYVLGESVNVKILPTTDQGTLDLAYAIADSTTLNQRAFRPYPPANLRIGDTYGSEYDDFVYSSEMLLTWRSRDRLQQTAELLTDYYDDVDIGPEDGTTFQVEIDYLSGAGWTNNWEVEDVGALQTYTFDDSVTPLPVGAIALRFRVAAFRDTLRSWQSPELVVNAAFAPRNVAGSYLEPRAPASLSFLYF